MSKPTTSESLKKPYRRPALRVFGTVAAVTATMDMSGTIKDGGPNNSKS